MKADMLIRADARAVPLRDGCVDCVVTSPPYFGLRDYGTAQWSGGDPDCDHVDRTSRAASRTRESLAAWSALNAAGGGHSVPENQQFRATCDHCGATRVDRQIGLEPTPDAYVATLVGVFRELRRVMKADAVCWLNLGDSYTGSGGPKHGKRTDDIGAADYVDDGARRVPRSDTKEKDLLGIPWRVAFALQADGWYLRSDVIWSKPNPMPESVTDRPTKAHEYVFLLTRSERYFYDGDAIREHGAGRTDLGDMNERGRVNAGGAWSNVFKDELNGRNKRTVWTVATMPYSGAHFATMPERLIEPCILAGCRLGGLVFDPFVGSGTVVAVAERLGRRGVGVDLAYHDLSRERTAQRGLYFGLDGSEVVAP